MVTQVGLFTGLMQDTTSSLIPDGGELASLVRPMPAQVDRISFAKVISGGIDTAWGSVVITGSGQTINQAAGNLVLTAGTTVRAETILRGTNKYSGAMRLRCRSTLSQRIVNQSFYVELVDVVGVGCTIVINSATSVTVTWPTGANPFTSQNVGQGVYLGAYAGTGTFIPGRYVIASVSGDSTTYTVAGFAVGSGVCDVFGWNYMHTLYDSTTASLTKWDTQRNGWASGDTSITINTTASPGHQILMTMNDMQAGVADQLVASALTLSLTNRGSRVENVPDDANLCVQIRVVNGTTAPASNTTWTIGLVSVSNWAPHDVSIQDIRPIPPLAALPVDVQKIGTIATTGSSSATLVASNVRAGFIGSAGIWYDTSIAALGASATYTGVARDLTGSATSTAFAIASAYPMEYRASACSDVSGTLYLEVSRDSSTWRRVKSQVAAAATGTGTLYYAEILLRPSWRYVRPVYINDAGAQAHFTMQEMLLAD